MNAQEAKYHTVEKNPCFEEHNLAQKCLFKNNFNRDPCVLHFDNYKACKKFWNEVQKTRSRQNIEPALPPLEERRKIKADYLNQFK
ncbi:hypothetical protein HCN44_009608 [Aphidius gifuensis]|uniref:Coiled-coil-helix-coiled-coil-helix domain-containing protein 7 n=1 Tax=Aphidius gifuensis TaxID=684658 RepID=A0A835CZ23_APHGI|nr:coiled-coil-helix-coiled-coil-helix domain-containing protein 7 [Aphidius gifuensis]KAF7998210.1 hypothetical protein HCN44_009608 [Aphidius gifuensis]